MARSSNPLSITNIAKEAGVSASTVSRVINRRVGVSEKQRKVVDKVLRKYEFQTERFKNNTIRIAVLTDSNDFSNYIRKACQGIYSCDDNQLDVVFIPMKESHRGKALKMVRDQQCYGAVVLVGSRFSEDCFELAKSGLPVVLLDEAFTQYGIGFVDNDSYTGSRDAASYLLKLGHRKIGYIRGLLQTLNHIQRFKGYENAMQDAGINVTENLVVEKVEDEKLPNTSDQYVYGYYAMLKLFEQTPDLTAVMAVDDNAALGAMKAIRAKGLSIPEDISIVGFDNYPESDFFYPPLTTVEHPVEKAASMAVEELLKYIRSGGKDKLVREILPTKLVIKESTGPVPANR